MNWYYKNLDALKMTAVERALAFLRNRYELTGSQVECLKALPIHWTSGWRSRFLHTGKGYSGYSGNEPRLQITLCDNPWHTYNRARVGITTPPEGIRVPRLLYVTLGLIHEYTHAIQYGVCGLPLRPASEVETTRNEIVFVEAHTPWILDRMLQFGSQNTVDV
jgi:hypothetical protein